MRHNATLVLSAPPNPLAPIAGWMAAVALVLCEEGRGSMLDSRGLARQFQVLRGNGWSRKTGDEMLHCSPLCCFQALWSKCSLFFSFSLYALSVGVSHVRVYKVTHLPGVPILPGLLGPRSVALFFSPLQQTGIERYIAAATPENSTIRSMTRHLPIACGRLLRSVLHE